MRSQTRNCNFSGTPHGSKAWPSIFPSSSVVQFGFMVSYLRGARIRSETTHVIVRWTQVDGVTLHDGTPRYAPQRRGEELLVFHFDGDKNIWSGALQQPVHALQTLGLL